MTTIDFLLRQARVQLIAAGCETAGLDARLLMQAVMGLSHGDIIADGTKKMTPQKVQQFGILLQRRLAHEPVSRILGLREFYGRDFQVSPAVLDPRPDTEALVELCLDHLPQDQPLRILDLGTGSGILALTLCAERPFFTGVAVDVSAEALEIARRNAIALGVADRVEFVCCSWFGGVAGCFDFIVSNPPYIESAVIPDLAAEVKNHDPHRALDGGSDGLAAYRQIAAAAKPFLTTQGLIALEIGSGQEADVTAIFAGHDFASIDWRFDLAGRVRALLFCRTDKA